MKILGGIRAKNECEEQP